MSQKSKQTGINPVGRNAPPGANPYDNAELVSCDLVSDDARIDATITKLMSVLRVGKTNALVTGHKKNIESNLRYLIINLLRVWRQDAKAYVAYHRRYNEYLGDTTKLTFKFVEIVDAFAELGLLESKKGFQTREGKFGGSRIARMKPTAKFVRQLLKPIENVTLRLDRSIPLIVLKDEDKQPVPVELAGDTEKMNNVLLVYLDQLEGADIALPDVDAKAQGIDLRVSPLIRRVFNKGSFALGGRIYGPWWQRIDKATRAKIRINGEPTVELDYEAQHLNHLYARKGLSVYDEIDAPDPYEIDGIPRAVSKAYFRIAINAESSSKAYMALRDEFRGDGGLWPLVATQEAFEGLQEAFLEVHPIVKQYLYSGVGLELQYEDSEVCMFVVRDLTAKGIPVLTVHDSFIVPKSKRAALQSAMTRAYSSRTDHLKVCRPRIK